MISVKICGLSDAAGVDAAIEHGADWLGFVFFRSSPRAVTPAQAAGLSRRHPGGAARAGLFVRASDPEIARCLARVGLAALQIYDTPERAREIAVRFGVPVWLACPVAAAADLPGDAAGLSRLVIESPPPGGADRPGGNGVRLDWSILDGWKAPAPWLLAGGLDPSNVAEAIRRSGTTAVDVSSGVEAEPGRKDPARIAAFIAAART